MTKISEISFLNFFSIMISLLKIKISAPERMNFNDIFYVANQIILLRIRLKKEVQENYNNSRSYPLLSTNFTLCFASSIDWILAILASCSAFSSFSYKDIGLRIKRLNLKAPPDIPWKGSNKQPIRSKECLWSTKERLQKLQISKIKRSSRLCVKF